MAKEKSGKDSITPPDNAIPDKKVFWTSKKLETVVAILLGIATLLSAWSSWIGSLHSGIQSINFTKSNNTSSEGTAAYNSSLQMYIADYMVWNTLCDYTSDLELAKAEGNEVKVNPFEMPGISEKYFGEAQKKLAAAHELLEEGQRDNTKGDSYNLVSVIYSLVLFLLGITNVFKNMPNKVAVMLIAFFLLVFAFIYMCSIPLPTGFRQMNFFEFNK